MNMNTIDIDDVEKVEAKLRNLPFDFHVLVDVPPRGPRAVSPLVVACRCKTYLDILIALTRHGSRPEPNYSCNHQRQRLFSIRLAPARRWRRDDHSARSLR